MEMTWENLTKLFTWAAQHGSEAPLADTAAAAIVIDGTITKEDLDRFMTSHSEPPQLFRTHDLGLLLVGRFTQRSIVEAML